MTDQTTGGVPSDAGSAPTGGAAAPSAPAGGESFVNLGPTFTPDQLRSMADDLVSRGVITREQANESLAADGALPEAAPTDYSGLSSEAAEIDAAFPPVASIAEYEMPPPAVQPTTPDEQKMLDTFDRESRTWMATARLPREIGSALAKAANETASTWPAMAPDQQKAYEAAELAKLRNVYGANTDAKLSLARQLVNEVAEKMPSLRSYLDESGAGSNAMVIMLLAEHADRLAARLKS